MAPLTRRTNSRSRSETKHSQLSNKPSFQPSTSGDDSLSSNSEEDYPGSAKVSRRSNKGNKTAQRVVDSNNFNLCFSEEEDGSSEIESSGISSGGWSETSGYSSSAGSNTSNRDSYRDIDKKLQDSSGDGLCLISNDAFEQDEEDEHQNSSSTPLSLTQPVASRRESFPSPRATPTGVVSFGGNIGRENTISPITMGGSEDAANYRLYDSKYEGSLSDLGIVESSNNQFCDDSDEEDSAPATANYFVDHTKRSKQTSEPDPILKPAVSGRPPTPPPPQSPTSPQKRSRPHRLNVALRKSSSEPLKKKYSKIPVVAEPQKKSRSSPTKGAGKRNGKSAYGHGGTARNDSKHLMRRSGLTVEDYGFATTICSFCSEEVGTDIRQCMSCKDVYFCGVCGENDAVNAHQKDCAVWRLKGKPSDTKPVVKPTSFTSVDNENAIEHHSKTERHSSGTSSILNDSETKRGGMADDDLEAPDIIMCEPVDVTRTKVQEIGGDEEDGFHFSFESIPEFIGSSIGPEDHRSGAALSNDSAQTRLSKPQRKTVKRAQRSLAYLFGAHAPNSQSKTYEMPEEIVEEATSDEESFYSNREKSPGIKSPETLRREENHPSKQRNLSDSGAFAAVNSITSGDLPSKTEFCGELLEAEDQNVGPKSSYSSESSGTNDESPSQSSESSELSDESVIEMKNDLVSEENTANSVATEVLGASLSPTDPKKSPTSLCDSDMDESTGIPDDFHDEPLRQSSNSSLPLWNQQQQHSCRSDDSPEVFHDEPTELSRGISYGDKDYDAKERKRAEAAKKAHILRRRDRNIIALLIVALICTLMALSAVGGGILTLTFLAEDDQPVTGMPQTDKPKAASQPTLPDIPVPATTPSGEGTTQNVPNVVTKPCVGDPACDFVMGSDKPVFPPGEETTQGDISAPTGPISITQSPTTIAPIATPPIFQPATVAPTPRLPRIDPLANSTAAAPPTLSPATVAPPPRIAPIAPLANSTAAAPPKFSPATLAPTLKRTFAPATMIPTANKTSNETGSASIALPP